MNIDEFQNIVIQHVKNWDKKRNVVPTEQMIFTHIVEEVGELAYHYVNRDQRPDKFNESEVEGSIGDILIQTIRLANNKGLDIEKIILKIVTNNPA